MIDYCKRLNTKDSEKDNENERKKVSLEDELKKGSWAKEKGVSIIQSKKSKIDDDGRVPKYHRRKGETK